MESKLPKNWVLNYLYETVQPVKTGVLKFNNTKNYYSTGSIKGSNFNIEGEFNFENKPSRANREVIKFDVLQARMENTDKAVLVDDKLNKSLFSTGFIQLRPYNNTVNSKYIYYFVKSEYFNYQKNELASGTTQVAVNDANAKKILFPLPPLAEQQRIVTKLDTLFGSLDALKIRLNNIPQLIKNFKQAVLTQAVTGKLTQEWRVGKELEYASLLNKNNQVEFEIINFDFLPNNWLKTALGNYANCSRGKFSVRPRNDPRYFDGNYPFMQIGDLPREGGYTSDYSKTLNEEGIKVSKSFPKGTVVVAIVGATIGLTGILEKEMFFPDSLIGLNCENFISNQYLEYYLRLCKNGFREISYAGGGQPNIKLPTIKNLELLIPPLKEQTEIVKRVENLFSKADAIEKQYKTLKEKIDRLPQAILAKAFKGELVAQLPTDGDAKDLLEEIKKLKESLVVKPKKKVVRNKK
ncbi:restriction endonuclease subunit S [Tenacibaculum dicentrarchi]|nr:restriction endonuclease subunit S [Tenacibaculum dicentrarchi]